MTLLKCDEKTLWTEFYNGQARERHRYGEISGDNADFYRNFFEELPVPHRVADFGCGYGRFVPLLERMGIGGYLGIDNSADQVAFAKELYPGRSFDVCDLFDVGEKYEAAFDGFLLNSVLMCIPRDRLAECFASIRKSLKSFAIGTLATGNSASGDFRHEFGMQVVHYSRKDILEAGRAAGFDFELLFEVPALGDGAAEKMVIGVLHAI